MGTGAAPVLLGDPRPILLANRLLANLVLIAPIGRINITAEDTRENSGRRRGLFAGSTPRHDFVRMGGC